MEQQGINLMPLIWWGGLIALIWWMSRKASARMKDMEIKKLRAIGRLCGKTDEETWEILKETGVVEDRGGNV
jgi:hypothetical protein